MFHNLRAAKSTFPIYNSFSSFYMYWYNHPPSSFPILEPENPWIDELYIVQKCRATGFKAPKLLKSFGQVSYFLILFLLIFFQNPTRCWAASPGSTPPSPSWAPLPRPAWRRSPPWYTSRGSRDSSRSTTQSSPFSAFNARPSLSAATPENWFKR